VVLDRVDLPIVLAPLSGGPSTPELAAAVSEAGGLGFLAAGYLSAAALMGRLQTLRELSSRPVGVNLFTPGAGPTDPAVYGGYLEHLRAWSHEVGAELGDAVYSDDDWEAKLELLRGDPPAVVSFTFAAPPRAR
jgi:nitronate monooxygenase